jgi:ribonuclease HI
MHSPGDDKTPPIPRALNPLPIVDLFTDGSCRGKNRKFGGWAFILRHRSTGTEKVQAGGLIKSSSEQAEIHAVINGLSALKRRSQVQLHCDNIGVITGISHFLPEWKRFGWRLHPKAKKPIKNADLWKVLDALLTEHEVIVKWVKGHAGHPENERCDELSGKAADAVERNGGTLPPVMEKVTTPARSVANAGPVKSATTAAPAIPVRPASTVKSDAAPARAITTVKPAATAAPARLFKPAPPVIPAMPLNTVAPAKPGEKLPEVDLFTDGACIGNPGPGGWAFILRHRASRVEKQLAGGLRDTTNNRMEMLAVVQGLSALKRRSRVALFSDSQYVLQGIAVWMAKWKRFGWRPTVNARRKVKNADLWQRLEAVVSQHEVTGNWVRGHAGHPENERCDVLSMQAAEAALKNPNATIDERPADEEGLFAAES